MVQLLRGCLALAALTATGLVYPQPTDDSLTPDFAGKSAKERSRIAAKEEAEARADREFQQLMEEAERLFRAGDYDASLERFKEARSVRPYNVYPKVKIQDLQALIAKRDAARAEEPAQPLVPATKVEQPNGAEAVTAPISAPAQVAPEAMPAPPPPRDEDRRPVQVAPKPLAVEPRNRPVPAEQPHRADVAKRTLPDQPCTERMFREGTFLITERSCTGPEGTDVYRRVLPRWGVPTHFLNGAAIPERMWHEAFPEP